MTAAVQDVAAIESSAPRGYRIRSGIFRGFGTRHVILVVVFCIAYNFLGQLGWLDFTLPTFAKRMREFLELPVHLVIGFGAILSAVAAENIFTQGRLRTARYVLAVFVASVAGTVVLLIRAKYFGTLSKTESAAILFLGDVRVHVLTLEFLRPAIEFLRAAYISVLLVALHAVFEANRRAGMELHAARIAALAAEHELVEGDLRAMQARVAPELLFDSLREVDTAYTRDPASGQSRLDALIRYLRAALPGDPAATSTVARERELALAYVALAAPQDGAPEALDFEADSTALSQAMPSMLLLPLVRWALAGGPAGRLRVRIRRCDGRAVRAIRGGNDDRAGHPGSCLEIRVENDASSDRASDDSEVISVRARLEQLYADRARLEVWSGDSQRRAVLELPLPAGSGSELLLS